MERSTLPPPRARPISDETWDMHKMLIVSKVDRDFASHQILSALEIYSFTPTAFQLAARLCRWGIVKRHGYSWEVDVDFERLATSMAKQTSDEGMERIWNARTDSETLFMCYNFNVLASYFQAEAVKAYHPGSYNQANNVAQESTVMRHPPNDPVNELPRQPDRKVCMTCGGRVDGVIYCSEQCRPSASLDWYSHNSDRAETPTITAGFRTAHSRFLSPSADSQATFDSTQFAPPPYGLVDANPPTPKFVPIKIETLEEELVEVMETSSGVPNSLRLPPIIPGILKHRVDLRPPRLLTDLGRFLKFPWILDAPPKIAQFASEPSIAPSALEWNCIHNKPFVSCGICQGEYWEAERVMEEHMTGVRQRDVGLLAAQARQ